MSNSGTATSEESASDRFEEDQMDKQKGSGSHQLCPLSRREIVAGAAGAALAGMFSGSLPRASAQGAAPKRGGTVRIGLNGASSTDSLDPGKMITGYTYTASRALRNN